MEIIRPRTWHGFVRAITKLRAKYGTHTIPLGDGQVKEYPVKILFRGQSDSRWELSTTLERRSPIKFDVPRYYRAVNRAVKEIESYSGKDWGLPIYSELVDRIEENQEVFKVELPAYAFLVYLRHHRFPSPLLDWTESPYIAAYFAFVSALEHDPAIYCYIETPELIKAGRGSNPRISVQGPYVKTHTRHFAQKAWYTIATQWNVKSEQHYFCPHELIFDRDDDTQDLLFKIVMPLELRREVLTQLADYNINHYTLFDSEESLVMSLATRIFDVSEA